MKKYRNNFKFTLIELLVVVAIIGILASLLLPSLRKSRGEARKAVCLSQQKQMGYANGMYLSDNDDRFIESGFGYNGNSYYRSGGPYGSRPRPVGGRGNKCFKPIYDFDYTQNLDMWNCPSQNRQGWYDSLWWERGFRMNRFLADQKITSVSNSSATVFTADSLTSGQIHWNPNSLRIRHVGYKANAVFLDGHVESMTDRYLWQNPHIIAWNANTAGHPWNSQWILENFIYDGLIVK